MFSLPSADHWSEDLHPAALGKLHYAIRHLLNRLAGDLLAAGGAIGLSGARVEQAEVIVDLGDGPHRGARVLARALLFDGDGGREAVDRIEVRLLHLREELARIRGERFDVAALPLGEDGVEGQRGLARAREAGDYDELVAGDSQIEVAEIVLAGPADDDLSRPVGGDLTHRTASRLGPRRARRRPLCARCRFPSADHRAICGIPAPSECCRARRRGAARPARS